MFVVGDDLVRACRGANMFNASSVKVDLLLLHELRPL
jgi:hypothetical protein